MDYKYPHAASNRKVPDHGILWAKYEFEYIHLLIEQGKNLEVIKLLREIYKTAYNEGIEDGITRAKLNSPVGIAHADKDSEAYRQGYHDCRMELFGCILDMQPKK